MKRFRLTGVVAIAICLVISLGSNLYVQRQKQVNVHDSYSVPLTPAPVEEDPTAGINEDFTLNEKYSSHFPLIVIDTDGEEPPITTKLLPEESRYVTLEDVEPYVPGTFYLIDNESGVNRPGDSPAVESLMKIKRRGNSSMHYDKAQYNVKLLTESGQNNDVNLLNMGEEHEWILNGSMTDKSMMRNYLGYRVASRILPFTPDSRYCEVIFKNGDQYTYQGVYLLLESIKQGPNRVDISDYRASQPFNSFLLRRDRYDESDDRLLEIDPGEGTVNRKESFFCLYPRSEDISEKQKNYVENTIASLERALYSNDSKVFVTYKDYIDVDSFVDYFIISEFLANYDAGQYSTYMYQEVGGKLKMGPVWDYDGAMDNYKMEELDLEVTAFQTKPWFERLALDKYFLRKVEKRYAQLRRGILSEETIIGMVDDLEAYIGGAREREWMRWNRVYTQGSKFSLEDRLDDTEFALKRESSQYEQEIYRLKTVLRRHGAAIPKRLRLLEWSTGFDSGARSYQGIALLLAAAIFFIPVYYVNRR